MPEFSNVTENFLEHLVANEVIDAEAALKVLDEQRAQTPPIGRISLLKGFLTMKQVFEILKSQVDSGLRFGEQAIVLDYLTENELTELLEEQIASKPSIGGILYDMGYAKKGVLNKNRREFMRTLECLLT